ncbi:FAD:protein FMN transferase [Arundinibacter roseus]|uniref:FAD:protein FMN transferase n=1 Tax=Arundinibacter roseus TaxID=2070510 RepID=UPI0014055EF7|nr:FAD:protein FMN transferase [Arundinibacter roseus]
MPSVGYGQAKRYKFQKMLMGSPFQLVLYSSSDSVAQEAARKAFVRIEQLNERLSDYRDGSEINRLSATAGKKEWMAVSDDLFRILEISRKISRQTQGAFDVTVGPVVQLWRRALRRNHFPEPQELENVRKAVNYKYIRLRKRNRQVMLTKPSMRLDVGGIGKGFAADEALKIIKQEGISSALIDAGGDLTLADPPPGKTGWTVEITSGNGRDSTAILLLANVGVATSGATYRYLEHEGKRYSHIVNPKTGVGLRFHVRTTVVAPNGTLADALATACSVAGIQKSKKMLRRFPEAKVWLLEIRDGKQEEWKSIP